jgi:uncharacterized protein with beta-barrel porin domain
MNKAHRVVWSSSQCAFVVTHEHAKSAGKPAGARRVLATAIALGMTGLLSPYAAAGGSCANSGESVVQGSTTLTCTLASGGTLNVTQTGEIKAVGQGVVVGVLPPSTTPLTVNENLIVRNAGRISGVNGVLLDRGAASGSLAVTNTGVVASSVAGGGAIALRDAQLGGWIRNAGRLEGTGKEAKGIDLQRSVLAGNIDNRNAISAAYGISVDNSTVSGAIINKGNISSNEYAIYANQSRIAGSINQEGSAAGGKSAIWLSNDTIGGSLNQTGSIWAQNAAVVLTDTQMAGSLSNSGLVEGLTAVKVQGGSLDGLRNNGTLSGKEFGVQLSQTTLSGGISNSGTVKIVPPANPKNVNANIGTGLMVDLSSVAKDINNTGSISGGTLGGGGIKVGGSRLAGGIVNGMGGTLTGADQGLHVYSSSLKGSITNDGVIAGERGTGLRVITSLLDQNVINRGSISGLNEGVWLSQGSLGKDITNSGRITSSGRGLVLAQLDTGGSLNNSGTITGSSGAGVQVDSSNLSRGGISNDGTIGGATGIDLTLSSVGNNLRNTGMVYGNRAISLSSSTIGGAIENTGSLIGSGNAGLYIGNYSTVGNGISNSGTVRNSIDGPGVLVTDSEILQGGISNRAGARIQGSAGLVVNNSSVSGGISNAGTLSYTEFGAGAGLELAGSQLTGNLNNSGTLIGNTALDVHQSTITGHLLNSGDAQGYVNGAIIRDSVIKGDLRNSGTMSGRLGGLAVRTSTITGQLVNSGTVSSRNGTLVVQGSTIAGGITNTGVLNSQDGNYVLNSTVGNFVNTGSILGGGAGLTFDASKVTGSVTNSGLISGGRFSLLDSSGNSVTQLVINGNNTARFQGEVFAPQARVSVAQGSAYTLNNGNLFTVADFTNRGTLTLASGGVSTIAGNFIQTSDGTLRTQAADANTFGRLVVGGTATLPGQAKLYVDVTNSGQSFSGATLNNVLSAGTLNSNGTFAVTSNSQLFNFTGVKDGNTLDLKAAPKSTSGVTRALQSQGGGNLSAARALDGALASNASLTPFFVGASSNAQVASAVSQTLPSNAAAASEVSQSTLATITDVVQSRINATTGLASGDGFYGDNTLWMKPFGSWINQSERGGSPGYDASVYGMAFGVDAPVNELTRLGLSFSYANADTNSKADNAPQSAKIDLYQLMGYGSHTLAPNTELSFHVGVGQNRNDGERRLDLGGVSGKASSNYDSRSVTAGVALAKAFDLAPTTRFVPSVRADYTWIKDDSYREKGSAGLQPLLLDVEKHQTDQLILGLDGKLSHEIVPGTVVTGNLGVGYDVIHDGSTLTSTYAGAPGQSFNTVGLDSSPWLARGGVGLATKIASTELSVNYDAETRSDYTNQTVSLKLKVPF